VGTSAHHRDGAREVRIFNEKYPVRARIEQIHGFSSHADQNELVRWLSAIKNTPRRVFVVHGEKDSSEAFAQLVNDKFGWKAQIPGYRDEVVLD
jgi:metallo-beta-lactamase family protein